MTALMGSSTIALLFQLFVVDRSSSATPYSQIIINCKTQYLGWVSYNCTVVRGLTVEEAALSINRLSVVFVALELLPDKQPILINGSQTLKPLL